jgi:hypothetical protein
MPSKDPQDSRKTKKRLATACETAKKANSDLAFLEFQKKLIVTQRSLPLIRDMQLVLAGSK